METKSTLSLFPHPYLVTCHDNIQP